MDRKAVLGIMLTLLLIGTLSLVFVVGLVGAGGTVYIRADGSVDPVTAPIERDGDVYTFTDNVNDTFVIERDNIVVDGSGYTVQGPGNGTILFSRNNVTIKNLEIKAHYFGIYLYDSSNIIIQGNTITNNYYGVELWSSSNNFIYHNNFINNTGAQISTINSTNVWDDGYPSGGNYWSDYNGTDSYSGPYQNETGSDGIGDTPYFIDVNNQDSYPLMEPYSVSGEAPIIIGTTAEITVLDPAETYDYGTWDVFHNIGEGLLKYKPGTTELEFGIAENYTVSGGGFNYTFKLREGMYFTDGEPLSAAAVKWSIDRVISLDLGPSWLVSEFVDSVEVVGNLTVRFILKKAVSYFPVLVASTPYFPVSSNSYPANETAEPTVGHYGPYKIKNWTRDVELVLEANSDYYGAQPRSKYIVTKFFVNATTMKQALEDGEIDIAWRGLGLTDIVDLRENPDFNIVETLGALIRFMVLRCNMTPFDDVRLRRAVAASINRTRISTEVYMDTVEPLYSTVPSELWSHIDAFKEEYGVRNLTLARELLTAAGYNETSKFEFDLWHPQTTRYVDVATKIKSDLEETGMMEVTLKSVTWATYIANIQAGVMPIFLIGWMADYIDPDNFLTPFLHSGQSPDLGVFYNNTLMDTILDDAAVELNVTRRTELYEDAQRLLAEDAPLIPLSEGTFYAVAKPNIEGIYLSPTMLLPYYTIYKRAPRVYVDPLISYVGVGETFSIDVSVADVTDIYRFEFKLSYNTTFLDAIDIVIQPFLNEPTLISKMEINDTLGFVWVAVTSQPPAEGANGSGALATIIFQVTGLGECVLDLYDTNLSDSDGFPISLHSVEDGYYEGGTTQVVSTESTLGSYHASLAVDSNGTIHVAWYDSTDYGGSGTDLDIFYKRFVPGTGWTTTEVVSTESTSASYYPSLAVDSSGNVHIAWQEWSGTDYDIFYKRYVVGVGWTTTEVVSTESTGNSYVSSLAVDSNGNVHVAWYDYTDLESGSDADIFYKRYEVGVGNWTSTAVVSTESTANSLDPSLAVDSSGNIHVAWWEHTGTDYDILYKRYEVGVNWTSTAVVSTESTGDSWYPSLAVDLAGNVHVAWQDATNYAGAGTDPDIFYKRYEVGVGNWTSTEVVSTESSAHSSSPSLAVDLSGDIHVAWADVTNYAGAGTDWDIFYKRYEVGFNWTSTQVVSTESTSSSSGPCLAVELTRNVHVIWHDLTDYAWSGTDWDIFYRYLRVHSTQYPWSMFRHNLRHTGYTESPAPNTNQTMWNYTTGDAVRSSPAVADGKVYVGSDDGKVYALDASTGAHVWNYTTGYAVYSSPAVADGRVYVGSVDDKVYALDASTGEFIWSYTTGGNVLSSPAVADGKVYVGSHDYKVYALNATTGAFIWSYTTGGWVWSSPAVVDGKVYVGSTDNKIYCLDASTGEFIWSYTTGGWVWSSPAVANSMVYIGSRDGKVYALNATTGAFIWSYTTGGWVWSSPAVVDGKVYVGSNDGKVYALNATTGQLVWYYTTGGEVLSSPAVADGKVYVGSYDRNVYALDASTGAHIWNYTTGDAVRSSPAVADGMLFVGSLDQVVYAFGNIIRVPEDYPTVQEAIDAATPGATIIIAPGTYYEDIVIDKPLTIIGTTGSSTTFAGGGSGIAITIQPEASGTIVTNVVITNWDQGIFIDNSSQCRIYANIMFDMVDSGIVLEGNNAADTVIESNTIYSNNIAINLAQSSTSNTIYNNTISLNTIGLYLESSGNTIYANTISQNNVGINLTYSNANTIYWNNFISNLRVDIEFGHINTWDNGYPAGGNYWSDYEQRYPNAEEFGSGIWNTPYVIDDYNVDNYPLMNPTHEITVTLVIPYKTVVGQGYSLKINVTVTNQGRHTETFRLTLHANATIINILTGISLTSGNPSTITFIWNTAGFAYGKYTITAEADAVPGEIFAADNTHTNGNVIVTIPGDVDGDYYVGSADFSVLAGAYGSSVGDPFYIPEADMDCDGYVGSADFSILAGNYGKTI